MSTERREDAEAGFLIYLKTGNLQPIVGNHMDRRGMYFHINRNHKAIAKYLKKKVVLKVGSVV